MVPLAKVQEANVPYPGIDFQNLAMGKIKKKKLFKQATNDNSILKNFKPCGKGLS
jgi:hypothetical protein